MYAKLTLGLVLTVSLLAFGCDKKGQDNSPPSQPTTQTSDSPIGKHGDSVPCADGTMYRINSDTHKLIWLVQGKAVVVNFDDFNEPGYTHWYGSDAIGGAYISGKTHLWYVKSGIAMPVTTAQATDIGPEEHKVTRQTVLWYAMKQFGNDVYNTGYDVGKEEGLEEPRDSSQGGGGE